MFVSLVHRLQDLRLQAATASVSRRGLRMTPARLIAGLPALGSVLYVPMRPGGSTVRELPRGLLVEAMQLVPLLQTRWLMAASMITVEGPREWIECMDREGRACTRLHLLPDTDYLAWDRLLAGGEPMPASKPARWLRPASAQVLRFHTRRLAGLDVLGAEATAAVSPLSRQLAGRIAHAETVPLQPMGGG
ncbi:hypothetical protein ASG75_07530 [Rhodanobacter sp. Soil772]|uniref:hypothetical protein n=1 Tax=Rhodanobacter sp. Soil772 TaxID=1736406 RepID=UPI000700AAE9|nr:hypothetical protein [Rhodanobacter sp. Soil772]KRE85435.1 hypothetical protein ASG75_07530 [Rhodanobacter sp. Soil772]